MIGTKTKQQLILDELARANEVIIKTDAVGTLDDGFQYVIVEKLPSDFVEYYTSPSASAYAMGAA